MIKGNHRSNRLLEHTKMPEDIESLSILHRMQHEEKEKQKKGHSNFAKGPIPKVDTFELLIDDWLVSNLSNCWNIEDQQKIKCWVALAHPLPPNKNLKKKGKSHSRNCKSGHRWENLRSCAWIATSWMFLLASCFKIDFFFGLWEWEAHLRRIRIMSVTIKDKQHLK